MKVTIHRPRMNSLKRLSLSLQREISAKITSYFLVFLYQNLKKTASERATEDTSAVIEIVKVVDPNIDITTVKPVRLGRYAEGRYRTVRVTLESEQRVSEILRNGRALKNYRYKNSKVFITPDRTPRQLLYYKKLRSQLQEKINSEPGTNWKIRYIHGAPKIVSENH
nr:unnamed protein product [Callosobruchus analis]